MDSTNIFKNHEILLGFFGLWPPPKRTLAQFLRISIFFYALCITFLSTLAVSSFYIASTKQAVDNLIVSTSSLSAFLRGIIFYYNESKRVEMFGVIAELDKKIQKSSRIEINIINTAKRTATILFRCFSICYAMAIMFLTIQNLLGKRREVYWTSTTLLPYGISENELLYWFVFALQGLGNITSTVLSCFLDTYTCMLMIIFNGHADIMFHRFQNVGKNDETKSESISQGAKMNNNDEMDKLIVQIQTSQICSR